MAVPYLHAESREKVSGWVQDRVPAQGAGARPMPGIQRAAPVDRVQGDNACAGCKGKSLALRPEAARSGPVKCRVSTLCTGYYLSKTQVAGERKLLHTQGSG